MNTTNIDLYSGQVSFPVQLASLPGRNGLDVSIGISYNSQVQTQAITWNKEAPTSVVGLGWDLPINRIVATIDFTGNRSDDSFFLLSGGSSGQLLCTGMDTDGSYIYESVNYAFWKIRYQPSSETWTIIHENGDIYTYGNSNSGHETVQWAVKWNNWVGSSNQENGQQLLAVGWNLNKVTNRFGDLITYKYRNVSVAVANADGLSYTQACYLSAITGVDGSSIKFNYLQKDANEYQQTHTNPPPPNAYQDRIEMLYLDNVQVFSPQQILLYTTNLIYSNADQTIAFLGTGNLAKRLLTGVNTLHAGAPDALPGTLFSYYGQLPGDQVSNTSIYNGTTQALYGALKQVTFDMGGSTLYRYGTVIPDLSDRQQVLAPPVLSGVTFSNPLSYFADDYTLVTWYGSNNTASIIAYTWAGRWLMQDLGTVPVDSLAAYQAMQVSLSASLFAIYTQNQLHLYHANNARAGEWIQPSVVISEGTQNYFSTAFGADEAVQLVTADSIAAVIGLESGKLYRTSWDGKAWIGQQPDNLGGGATGLTWGLVASNNYLTAMYTSVTAADTLHLSLWYLSETGAWEGVNVFSLARNQMSNTALKMWAGNTFVAFSLADNTGGVNTASYGVVWWNESFSSVKTADFGTYHFDAEIPPAMILHNSFISFGQNFFRFDGKQWNKQNVAALGTTGTSTLVSLSLSIDQAVRISKLNDGNYQSDVIIYDPNVRGAVGWLIPSGMSVTNATQNVNVAATVQNAQSSYAIFNNKVYYCNSDGTWSECGLNLPTLTGNDNASVTLLASGFLLFQQSGNTYVYTLLNGMVQYPAAPIVLSNQQVYADGATMAGLNAFVSYTDTYGSSQSQLSLNRVTGNNQTGKQTAYVAVNTQVSNGYVDSDVYTAYEYDPASAVALYAGQGASFLRVLTIPGQQPGSVNKEFGWTENCFYNGLNAVESAAIIYPSGSFTNATLYYTLAAGLMYSAKTFPAGAANPDSSTLLYWTIYLRTLGNTGLGAYARTLRTERMIDNIMTPAESTYSLDTGLITTNTVYNYNSQGEQEQIMTSYTYFWEKYDQGLVLNLLTPIVLTSTANTTGTTVTEISSAVITYKDDWGYGTGQWNPVNAYQAQSADAPAFNSWNAGSPPPDPEWLVINTVLERSACGNITRSSNVLGVISSTLYDLNDRFAVCDFKNADTSGGEASYYGFMPYENPQGWTWSTPDSSIEANLTGTDYYTGIQSLLLPPSPGVVSGPCCRFQPVSQDRAYVFGAWVKSGSGFDPTKGTAQCTIRVYNAGDNTLLETYTLPIPNTNGQWLYLQQVADLPAVRKAKNLPDNTILYVWINAYNSNTSTNCLIDNMRFSPTDGAFRASVYNQATALVTASLDNNGQASRNIYDVYKQVVATTGPGDIVTGLEAFSYSSQQNGGTFLPQYPNSKLSLATSSSSMYYDFHNNYTNAAGTGPAWTYYGDDPSSWKITGGVLDFSGSSTDVLGSRATLTVYAFTNFAVRVSIPSHAANVGITNGELVTYWDATANNNAGAWTLARYVKDNSGTISLTTIDVSDIPVFGSSCVFAIIDNLLVFFVNGTQVFTYCISNPDTSLPQYGFPSLVVNGAATFDDMVVMDNPQMSVSFIDGLGNESQGLSVEGKSETSLTYPSVGKGAFTDSLGRPQYCRKPALPVLAIDQPSAGNPENTGGTFTYLIEGNQDTYLVNVQGEPQTLEEYLSGASGFAYSTLIYENSPLSRLISTILPRESNQQAQNFTITQSYGPATGNVVSPDVLPTASLGNYFMKGVTNQNGVTTYEVTDQTGNTLAQLTATADGSYNTTAMLYDASGRMVIKRMPNYFQPPANSQNTYWQELMTYTYTGLLSSRNTPDSGLSSFIYDSSGRMRFALNANGAVATIDGTICQQVIYYKYDNLDRLVELGYIQDPSFQWGKDGSTFQAKADDSHWPMVGDGTAGSVKGQWNKRYTYDFDPANLVAQNTLGRSWKIQVNNLTTDVLTESISYDQRGNKIKIVSDVPGYDNNARITEYTYNNQNMFTGIYYPYIAGARDTAFQVGYYYNRLGQLASVGNVISGTEVVDPDHPATAGEDRYVAYYYNPDGTIARQVLNNHTESAGSGTVNYAFDRSQSYNMSGWLTGIDDPFFSEEISYYEKQGYNGAVYYNGNISQVNATYKQTIDDVFPAAQYTYGYDQLNRITAAASGLGGAYSMFWGNNGTGGYDANGNIASQQRGSMNGQYNYTQPDGTSTVLNDHLLNTGGTAANTLDIDAVLPAGTSAIGDWSWGSNNGGPSTSGVTDKNTGTGKCLQLNGGSLGHYEYLRLDTYLSADGTYSLTYSYATLPGFNGPGTAGWYLSAQSAQGLYVEILIEAITDSAGSWKTVTIPSIDLTSELNSMGIGEDLVYITLELRNGMRSADGVGAGAGMQVNNITLASAQPAISGNYSYDANGNVIQSLPLELYNIAYEPVTGLTSSMNKGSNTGEILSYAYGSSDARVLQMLDTGTGNTVKQLYIQGFNNSPLMEIKPGAEGEVTTFFVYGVNGLIVSKEEDNFCFVLNDHLGSARVLTDNFNNVIALKDYLPNGSLSRSQGLKGDYLYTGQQYDWDSGLYNYKARMYDSNIGRFYACDQIPGNGSPYSYVNNNPTGYVDADGKYGTAVITGGLLVYSYYNSKSNTEFFEDLVINMGINLLSAHTLMRVLHVFEANIPVSGMIGVNILAATVLFTEGTVKAWMERAFRNWWYGTTSDNSLNWADGVSNGLSYFMFNFNIRSAISPRSEAGMRMSILYLKFPDNLNSWRALRGFFIPYKGITTSTGRTPLEVAAKRHARHHWNHFGFGPWIVLAVSENKNAIQFAERALIRYLMPAARLTNGQLQQNWPVWTDRNTPKFQDFLSEFVYSPTLYGLFQFNVTELGVSFSFFNLLSSSEKEL